MDHNFSILFFIFAALLLLYALFLAVTKDYHMLPYRATQSVKPKSEGGTLKDPEKYTVQLAKVIALVAAAIAAGAVVGLWNIVAGGAVMLLGTVAALWAGTKIVKN